MNIISIFKYFVCVHKTCVFLLIIFELIHKYAIYSDSRGYFEKSDLDFPRFYCTQLNLLLLYFFKEYFQIFPFCQGTSIIYQNDNYMEVMKMR